MSCEEFALHQAYWAREPSGPEGQVLLWAALMAAVANGPLTKKDKSRFKATDFWPANVWEPAADAPVTRDRKRMAPDLSHMRGKKIAQRQR